MGFADALRQLDEAGRGRRMTLPAGLDFSSNDYLGFKSHPALRRAAIDALDGGMDLGAGGSRLLRGHTESHALLEEEAARFFGAEKALYFSTGFQANYAVFTTLPDRNDTVVFDALIHASMKDGIHAGHAKRIKVPHNNLDAFEAALKKARGPRGRIWLAVESVYSMDGDCAPLNELAALCRAYDAWLVVDEAHATGVFGATGRGLTEGLPHDRMVAVHTCGKALGVAGGLVCAPADMIDWLVGRGRAFIYSTAPPPLLPHLVRAALRLVDSEPERRAKVMALRDHANTVLPVPASPTQIIPVLIGDDRHAVAIAAKIQEAGFDVRAIRPPTVPEGTARLRLSLNAGLHTEDIDRLSLYLTPLLQDQAA